MDLLLYYTILVLSTHFPLLDTVSPYLHLVLRSISPVSVNINVNRIQNVLWSDDSNVKLMYAFCLHNGVVMWSTSRAISRTRHSELPTDCLFIKHPSFFIDFGGSNQWILLKVSRLHRWLIKRWSNCWSILADRVDKSAVNSCLEGNLL